MDQALTAWNPWWHEARVPSALLGRRRRLTDGLEAELDGPEIIALAGIRRSGKTTIMLQLVDALLVRGVRPERILLANLEDPGLDDMTLDDLEQILEPDGETRYYLFLDEVQERPGWERWARVRHDQKRPLKIVVSGSSSDLTRGDYARLLTGRNLTRIVRPLDFAEYRAFRTDVADPAILFRDSYLPGGGFPQAVLRDPYRARALLEQHLHDIIHRDLAGRRGLDPLRVERLAIYLAKAFGGPHTKRRVAEAADIATDTLRTYLDAMQDGFLIDIVPRFTDSPKPARQTEGPFKVYWADTGLRNAVVANPDRDRGTQAENVVANHFVAGGRRPFYWTDGTGRREVDFLVPRPDGTIDAYQVWYDPDRGTWDDVPARELDAFTALWDAVPRRRRGRSTLVTGALKGDREGVQAVSLHDWLTDQTS